MKRLRPGLSLGVAGVVLAACVGAPSPTPRPSTPAPIRSPVGTLAPPPATPTSAPTATPAPTLSLEPPAGTDDRQLAVTVTPEIGADGGQITVDVTHLGDARIDELVLRWPTALAASLRLVPFVPSDERIRDGGPPLVQPWTKWVIGPGAQGEPAGTTSLGYGPLLPGTTLSIPLFVTRAAPGPISFDLQVLAGNDLLTLEGGAPAELRVEVP